MLCNIIAVLYLLLFWGVGLFFARLTLKDESQAAIFCLGSAYCVALLAMLPAAIALLVGFRLIAAICAGVLLVAVALLVYRATKQGGASPAQPHTAQFLQANAKGMPDRLPVLRKCFSTGNASFWLCVLPLACFTFYLLYTHVLLDQGGAYYTGQSGYGDIAMHLAFIKNIAVSGEMPPSYPLIAGQDVFGYPFLCECVSSVFLLFGAGLKLAYLLPCIPALFSVFGFGWLLAKEVLCAAHKACLAFFIFFLGGGFGFAYFMGSAEAFQSIFTGYYTTPTNYVTENIRWVNCIADLLVPQRATLMGWALLFPCLYLLYKFAFCGQKKLWLPLGLLAGSLPLMQTHSLLVLVMVSAVYLLYALVDGYQGGALQTKEGALQAFLPWAGYAALAGVLCLPQLCTVIFVQTSTGSNFLQYNFNWSNDGENYFWFYLKNIGVVYLLLLPAFLWADKTLRRWYGAILPVLAVSEFIQFQPNEYDNIKLLYIWFLYSCLLVAGAVCDWLALLPKKSVQGVLLAGVLFFATFSGVLTLGREVVSEYQVFNADDIAAAAFIEQETDTDALFLTGMHHLNPVICLAGRDILCGSTLYIYFHGMDYSAQSAAVTALYETPTEAVLAEWGIDYVFISSYERANYTVDEAWYAARYPVIYQNDSITIYQITAE